MEVLAFFVAVVVGFLVARRVTKPAPPRLTTLLAVRPIAARGGTYRDAAADASCTIDELRADLAAAGLPVTAGPAVLAIERGKEQLRITPNDASRITLASLDLQQSGCDTLPFELALVLAKRFGPLRLTDVNWGSFEIDGTRDVAALVEIRSERIRAIASAIARDMEAKTRAYGDFT